MKKVIKIRDENFLLHSTIDVPSTFNIPERASFHLETVFEKQDLSPAASFLFQLMSSNARIAAEIRANKIRAIKDLRAATNCDLVTAKKEIEFCIDNIVPF